MIEDKLNDMIDLLEEQINKLVQRVETLELQLSIEKDRNKLLEMSLHEKDKLLVKMWNSPEMSESGKLFNQVVEQIKQETHQKFLRGELPGGPGYSKNG